MNQFEEKSPLSGLTPQDAQILQRLIEKEKLQDAQSRFNKAINEVKAGFSYINFLENLGYSKFKKPKESAFDEARANVAALARWVDELKDLVEEIYTTAKSLQKLQEGGAK